MKLFENHLLLIIKVDTNVSKNNGGYRKGKKFMAFKTKYFLVALASLTLCVAGCSPKTPAAPTVDSIAVKENTAKTEFFVGDNFTVGGGKLVVTYSNQTTEEVNMTLDMIKNAPDMSSEHLNYTVNVEYEKKATSYVVNVRNPSVTSIAIKQSAQPLKKFLMGDEFTVAGGKLIVNYNNNSTQEIDMTLAMIKNAPTMNEPHANYEVRVEYGGAQTTYNVDVDQAFVLDSSNRVEEENYTKMNAPVVKTVSNVKINNYLAKGAEGKYAKLASTGRIYNYSSDGNSKIPGISAMKVTFTGGKLYLQVSRDLAGKIFTDKAEIPSGQLLDLSSMQANYFILSAGDAEVDIEKIQLVASGTERNVLTVNQLGQEYTGAKGDIIYKTVIEGDDATLVTLNKEQNDSYTAKVSVEGEQVKFTIANAGDLYFTVNEGRTQLTVDATKGIGAGFSGLAFNEVFTVEDFEEYEDTGVGYDDVTKSYAAMTGLRAEYHADFNNSETARTTSLLGWKLMGSSDYLTLSKNGGHNQSKAGVFKVSNTSGLRYVSMSSVYNVPKTLGKGSTFSFWTRGAVKTDGSSATTDTKIKVRVFYVNPVTAVGDSTGDAKEFTIPAGSDWKEYTMTLASNKEYYGYCIFSNSASQYLPIDDVKIYTASPYAEYVEPEQDHHWKAFTGQGTVQFGDTMKAALSINETYFNFGISADGNAKGYILGKVFTGTTYSIDESTRKLTVAGALESNNWNITMTGIEGTFNETYSVLSNVKFIGTIAGEGMLANNGSITIDTTALQGVQDFTGATTAALQATFNRWYYSDKWTADPGNADRVTAYTEEGYDDNICLRERGHAKHSLTFAQSLDPAISFHGMGYWVKNLSASKKVIAKYFSYTSTDLSGAAQMYGNDVTINAGAGWTLVVCDFQANMAVKEGIKNIRFYFETPSGTQTDYVLVDHIFFY